jgi:hypothetical protein
MDFAIGLLLILALAWLVCGGGIQSGAGRRPADARAIAALTQRARELFDQNPMPSHRVFVEKMGGVCRTVGVSTVAAFYGLRAMAIHGGITRERVNLLLADG